jgi:tetratricopeptide (TPR) repeat protein
MSNLGLFRFWRGELDEARAMLEQARELRDRLQGAGSAMVIDLHLAAVLRDLGEFDAASVQLELLVEHFRSVENAGNEPPTDLVMAENHYAQMWLMLGQPQCALASLRADDSATDLRYRARRLALRLRAARMSGDDALALLAEARALAPQVSSAFHRALFELELARALEPAAAAEELCRLSTEPAVIERPGLRLQAWLLAAQAELRRGSIVAARAWLDQVLPLAERVPAFDIDRAELWSISHEVLQANGEAALATETLGRAMHWLDMTADALPQALRVGFLHDHAIHRSLRECAQRLPYSA